MPLTQMTAANIDDIICFSATQRLHACTAHGARNTVQQLLRKTLNFISPEL